MAMGHIGPSGKEGMKARGYSPGGHGPHGGHHRKHFDKIPHNLHDHMSQNPSPAEQAPQGGMIPG